MLKSAAWVFAGAVLATAGAAHAQEAAPLAPVTEATAQSMPWYQRFTTSNGVTESVTGVSENDRIPLPAWTLNQRWGVTLDVREAQRIEHLPEASRGDQMGVGAYYQFTPRVRVGGQLSVETPERPGVVAERERTEPQTGVRLESAFRF